MPGAASVFNKAARRFIADTGGAGAVEFAICAPILISLLFGIFVLGWTQHTISSVRFGVDSASRRLSLDPDTTEAEIRVAVQERATDIEPGDLDVSLEIVTGAAAGRIGVIRAVYSQEIEVPGLFKMPIRHEVRQDTPLRAY